MRINCEIVAGDLEKLYVAEVGFLFTVLLVFIVDVLNVPKSFVCNTSEWKKPRSSFASVKLT